ncbi:hypothetical protein HDU87_003454 [Geranomyces variabilis]|uniref:GATA-type domain-containing protein n=1 Tax=Geranomyces variabilis TaxID=109894 RepID=A0AAD5XMK2_9FUNG|nr:hypothetical protein HDU87_003454 [Geranomyces variabilis]
MDAHPDKSPANSVDARDVGGVGGMKGVATVDGPSEYNAEPHGVKRRRSHTIELWNAKRSEFDGQLHDPNQHLPAAPTTTAPLEVAVNANMLCSTCGTVQQSTHWRPGPYGPRPLCDGCASTQLGTSVSVPPSGDDAATAPAPAPAPAGPVGPQRNAEGRVILSKLLRQSGSGGVPPPSVASGSSAGSSKRPATRPHPKLGLPSDRVFSPSSSGVTPTLPALSEAGRSQPSANNTLAHKGNYTKVQHEIKQAALTVKLKEKAARLKAAAAPLTTEQHSAEKATPKSHKGNVVSSKTGNPRGRPKKKIAAATPAVTTDRRPSTSYPANARASADNDDSSAVSRSGTPSSEEEDNEDPAVVNARLEQEIRGLRRHLAVSEAGNRDLEVVLGEMATLDNEIDELEASIIVTIASAAREDDMLSTERSPSPPPGHFRRGYHHVPFSQYPPIHAERTPHEYPEDWMVDTELDVDEAPIVLDFCKAVHGCKVAGSGGRSEISDTSAAPASTQYANSKGGEAYRRRPAAHVDEAADALAALAHVATVLSAQRPMHDAGLAGA